MILGEPGSRRFAAARRIGPNHLLCLR
jgi:hypothetical protein